MKFDEKLNLQLSLGDHLIKDFKEFAYGGKKVGYSIILMEPSVFLNHYGKEQVKHAILELMKDMNYSAYFLMFLFER